MSSSNALGDRISDWCRKIEEYVRENPGRAILYSNAATSAFFLYKVAQRHGGIVPAVKKSTFALIRAIPFAQGAIDKETAKFADKIKEEMLGDMEHETRIPTLPRQSMTKAAIFQELKEKADKEHEKWEGGKVSGTVYHGGQDLVDIIAQAYHHFCLSNPLHPDVFPSTRRMEAEVVAWAAKLFGGDENSCGTMTTGGTESILMACRSYRERASEFKGISCPNMVIPRTAHAAFDKACDYFGIEKRHVDVDQTTFKIDPKKMAKSIDSNTIMIVGSAPAFPQGVMDPIKELSDIALEKNVPLHVDCCLGSFLIPFAKEAGYPVPSFDFTNPGVTSISADTHKYGFAPKGSSVVLYRDTSYRRYQYYVAAEWTGGVYASPTISGSRAGGVIAGTWAAMLSVGQDGYVATAKQILKGAQTIANGIRSMEDVELYGEPDLSVVCFGPSRKSRSPMNIYGISDAMSKKNWNLNLLQYPASIHICVTYANCKMAEQFLEDLRNAIAEVKADPEKFSKGSAAVYGMAASLPDKAPVRQIAASFIDALYTV
eukprot:gb/GECG01016390.1/.p1 GENE.gb/GECG01016390.1/~~gb/GECG01016390.1/.p1  ORF type:complete len:544 (+),score=80.16 gb/GECG01016390.1/:1-1632(+)